jgi:DNA polymerase III epsilon subunit-like protein
MYEYNEKQKEFITAGIEPLKVIGIPGGGKTKSIIEYIIDKHRKKLINLPGDFLILTFSRKACNDFITKGKQINKSLFTLKNIRTIHSLAQIIMTKFCNKSCSSLKTIIIAATRVLLDAKNDNTPQNYVDEEIINENLQNEGGFTDDEGGECGDDGYNSDASGSIPGNEYDTEDIVNKNILHKKEILCGCKVIIVDEAQDVSETQYNLIMLIAEILGVPVIMVGDPNQNIYQFQQGSDKFIRNHVGREIVFVHNYRSTNEIVNFINEFRPWVDYPPMIAASDMSGRKPKIHSLPANEIVKRIYKLVTNSVYSREDIAIIGPVRKSRESGTDNYTNIGLSLIENYFSRKELPFIKYYSDDNKDEFILSKHTPRKEGHVNLITVHGSKGLEFKQVFILNFHFYTYGIWPTIENYNEFKYLWYVALSRAMESMHIFVDDTKFIFPHNCNPEHYELIGNIRKMGKLCFREETSLDSYSVTDIIGKFTDKLMFDFEGLIKLQPIITCDPAEKYTREQLVEEYSDTPNATFIIRRPLWSGEMTQIVNKNDFAALYGIYIESLFTLFIAIKNNQVTDYFTKRIRLTKNTILVPRDLAKYYNSFTIKVGKQIIESENGITFVEIDERKHKFGKEMKIFEFIRDEIENNEISKAEPIKIILESELKYISPRYAKKLLVAMQKNVEENEDLSILAKSMFDYVLYEYQISEEKKYYLQRNFSQELESLQPYVEKVHTYAESLNPVEAANYIFQKTVYCVNMNIYGIPDIVAKKKTIELKFTNTIDITHIIQLILYAVMRYSPIVSRELWDITIVNFQEGFAYTILINEDLCLFGLQKFLCSILKLKMHYNVFLYDLETTGLDTNTCEIIECNFKEYFYNHTFIDTLVLPIEPVPYNIVTLTGITNKELRIKGITIDALRSKIKSIFTFCHNPIFVAHNGTMFDHKIMERLEIFPKNYKFLLDSKVIIGQFYLKTNLYKTRETSLVSMYKQIVQKEIKDAHRAGADVEMINGIFKKLGVTNENITALV